MIYLRIIINTAPSINKTAAVDTVPPIIAFWESAVLTFRDGTETEN